MDLVAKTLAPVRRAAHQFFRCHLQLSLKGGLHVALVERKGPERPLSAAELAAERTRADFERIVAQLKQALDDELDARHSYRHLAFVEQALVQEGLQALYAIPLDVLQRGLEQFEELVSNWSPAGLASLRSRMAVALRERDPDGGVSTANAYRSAPPGGR